MTQKQINMIASKAKRWAKSYGFGQESEDIAQSVLLKYIKNKEIRVACACIDYVRHEYGRTGKNASSLQKQRINEKRNYVEIDADLYGSESHDNMVASNIDFSTFQTKLKSKERAIVTLKYKWDLTEKEIGDCFGVSESRICQILKEIKAKLSEIVEPLDTISQ